MEFPQDRLYEETINEYLIRVDGLYLISRAFSWSDSEEEYSFWGNLHSQWFKIIKKTIIR